MKTSQSSFEMKYPFFLKTSTLALSAFKNRQKKQPQEHMCILKKKTNTFKYMSALVPSSILYKDTHSLSVLKNNT